MRYVRVFIFTAVAVVALAACSSPEQRKGGEAAKREQDAVSTGFDRLTRSQQVPTFDWSQERQTLIDILSVRAQGVNSTTSFYIEGVGLVAWCPSVGAPVPSTYELTSTKQWVDLPGDHTEDLREVDQGEPSGVYPGDSNATWVLCVDDNGKAFAQYWEGPVGSTVGIVDGLPKDKRLKVNELTYKFDTKKD